MYRMQCRAWQRQQSRGKQSSVSYSVAAAFHTRRAGDMSCEWIEWEPSSHSSSNIILSLTSLCLCCAHLALPCYWNVSSVCLQQCRNSRLSQVSSTDHVLNIHKASSEDKDSACFSSIIWPGYACVSACYVNCHNLPVAYSFNKQLWIFQPLPLPLLSKPTVVRKCLSDNK